MHLHPYFTGPFDHFEESLSSEVEWDLQPTKEIIKKYGETVLEIGCGSGRITSYLASHGLKVTGIDNSEKSIQRLQLALSKSPELSNKISIIVGDFLDTQVLDSEFDAVLLGNLSLNLFWSDRLIDHLLTKVKKFLKPNGVFCFGAFDEQAAKQMSMYDGTVEGSYHATPFVDESEEQRLMWTITKFDQSTQVLQQNWFVELPSQEKDKNEYHFSALKEKLWTLPTVQIALERNGFQIVERQNCQISGGGAGGFNVMLLAAKQL